MYAGEIRVKTHFKSMETHSSIQGRRHQPIRVQYSASHGFLGPLVQATDLDKSYYQWISDEGPPCSHPAKDGPIRGRLKVGRPAHSTNRPQPSTWQLPIGPRSRFWEDHLLKPTLLAVAPSYIYERRGSISTHPPSATPKPPLWFRVVLA